ncbi:STAS domain-containing protein [Actinoplanes sp. NBC_00393]|uniref:STAS domain-containing protein n=1 Tax=Actinoplanes sp. NBC_00393 TaxID=2975953 RepID=UPI002E1FDC19
MNVSCQQLGSVARLTAAGEIDMATVGALTKPLQEAILDPSISAIEIDFGDVTFCDSSGVAALDESYADAREHGITLRVINLRPIVSRVLEITGLLEPLTQR